MAVFTPINLTDISDWIAQDFNIGVASKIQGIHGGIENSNFFLDTKSDGQDQKYVLTVFERLSFDQLPYYLNLMLHLSNKGIPVPRPVADQRNRILFELKGKPAAIVSKLPGLSRLEPTASHCAMVGSMLAKMHQAGSDFSGNQNNLRSLSWWQETTPQILPFLSDFQKEILTTELAAQEQFFKSIEYARLPQGASHCDLFKDNVLFDPRPDGDQLGGFFDFYFAGTDKWLFDLAVTANDWCLAENKKDLDPERLSALINAYQSVRILSSIELDCWQIMLRAAALRFWISRLWDFYLPRNAQMLTPHDPSHFEDILLSRRNSTLSL